ncbi:MAG: EF-P lysine aminoacylase GenX [Dehalococcoidales bacterium]|nr:EF-P lysine aminoacylase GenX [Dehalococcoidales bacterium]
MTDDNLRHLASIAENLKRRALILQVTRRFFDTRDFLEVETPLRSPAIAPEKEIVPFDSEGWFLSTSPELYMKRLLAAGYRNLYQISHSFRKGERGRWHNPEFTMLEWYRAGADYQAMINDTEQLVLTIARELGLGEALKYQGKTIDLTAPWGSLTVKEAYKQLAGWDPGINPDPVRFDTDMVTKVIPHFNAHRPTVILDYPAPMASLARLKPGEPGVAERAEVFIGGLEIANGYSELTGRAEQTKRFQKETDVIKHEQQRVAPMPEKFLEAMDDLPPSGGIALGLDRLVMLFCDAASIDEVIAFTADTA